MYLPNLKSVASPAPGIIGVTKKFGQSLDTPTLPLLQKFYGLLFGWMDLANDLARFEASPAPEIIAIGVLSGGCESQKLGKRRS